MPIYKTLVKSEKYQGYIHIYVTDREEIFATLEPLGFKIYSTEAVNLNEETLESEITSEKFQQTPMSSELLAASNKVITDILFG